MTSDTLPPDDVAWSWLDDTRDRISLAAQRRGSEPRQFAATLVAVFANETEAMILHVGDGAAVLKIGDEWTAPSWPENGEYASTTYFVTDDPTPRLRITRINTPPAAVAVLSDGMERLALNFAAGSAHGPFFNGIFRPLARASEAGRDVRLSNSLARYLDSAAVNERTDDDKSLVLASRI